MYSYYIFELEDGSRVQFKTGGTGRDQAQRCVEKIMGQKATLWKNVSDNPQGYGKFPYVNTDKY